MGFDLLALTLTNALYCMADSRVPGSSCVKPPGTRNTILFDISLATIELSENAQIPSSVGGGRRGVNKTGIRCAWLFWNLLEKAHEALLNAKEIYPCIFHGLVGKKSDLDLVFKKKAHSGKKNNNNPVVSRKIWHLPKQNVSAGPQIIMLCQKC